MSTAETAETAETAGERATTRARNDEFLALFAEEAYGRLARLSEQLLELESTGSNPELIASIFREAHTLKGAAAVVGIDDVTSVAHALEDLLEPVRRGERAPTPELVDVALQTVDGLTAMLPQVLEGRDCAEQATALERALRADDPANDAASVTTPAVPAGEHVESEPAHAEPAEEVPTPKPAPALRTSGDTINVPISQLDELVRLVGESAAAHLRVGRMVSERLGVDSATVPEIRDLSRVLNDLQERTMRARMVPVSTITDQLRRAVRDLARGLGKDVRWEARGEDTELDRGVLKHLADPLLHLIRNAVDHGVEGPEERRTAGKPEQATVRLHAMQLGSEVIITVTDDGRGIDVARVRDRANATGDGAASNEDPLLLIFRSGLSTATEVSELSGRGVGLDVVRSSLEAVRGRVEVHSEPGKGSEFRITVPITLAVLPCLLVEAAGHRYAIPMHSVVVAQAHEPEAEAHAEGRSLVWVGKSTVAVSSLPATLGLAGETRPVGPVVVVAGITRRHAFRVDALLGQRDVVVKGLGRLVPRLDVVAGASVEPDGSILVVLDAPGLIDRARGASDELPAARATADDAVVEGPKRQSILIVDDAMTVRELQRSIFERAGFDVRVASDGVDALARLAESPADVVLTDVEMPRMDGFGLTEAIRAHPKLANVPVLILTSRASDSDRQRGLDAGADGYIVKSAFDETSLLSSVDRVLGQR